MRVAMIGSGYVGLVTGACFSAWGWQVTCVDKDSGKIARLEQGEIPIYEPGLDALVAEGRAKGTLRFTTDLATAVNEVDAIFIAVGTPTEKGSDRADMRYVFAAVEEIAAVATGYKVIVTKSTVPVGTAAAIRHRLDALKPKAEIDLASNPEFLREGSAIGDFMNPDRVVIGAETERARRLLESLYAPLAPQNVPIICTDCATSEMIKYAANAFLATKIAYINQMADLAEKVGADVTTVARGMGIDKRIGEAFLATGPGFGGSCFPKDTRALAQSAEDAGVPATIVNEVIASNERRKAAMAEKIIQAAGGIKGKTVAIWGLAFKANTDDMREAASLAILPLLLAQGAQIVAYDPVATEQAKPLLPTTITYAPSAEAAAKDADVLVILTEWPQFKTENFSHIRSLMRAPLLVDLRNLFEPAVMAGEGFHYVSLGRATVAPASLKKAVLA